MLQTELDAATAVVRRTVDAKTYMGMSVGSAVSDHECKLLAYDVLDAAEKIRRARDVVNRAPSPAPIMPEVPAGVTIIPGN